MSEKKEELKNPAEYGYLGDEVILVPVKEYYKLKELVDETLMEETKPMYGEKYQYVDVNTGAKVGKLIEKNKPTSKKIVNIDGTMQAEPVIFRTPKGMKMLELKLVMNKIHLDMIEAGVAKHIPTLEAERKAAEEALSKK